MSLSLGLNSVPFPSESSPLVVRQGPLHRRRGVELGMALQMPAPAQFGYGYAVEKYVGKEAATAAAAMFTTESINHTPTIAIANNPSTGRLGYASSSSGMFGSAASADTTKMFWSPASAVVGIKGPLQPHVSNLPRRKPTIRRRD